MLKTIDLFAGCGGMSLGFQKAGFDIIAAYDNWKPAIDVYQANFDHPIYQRDLSLNDVVKEITDQKPEIIIGGPPCQDFSTAGHMDESFGRAQLSVAYSEIISKALPRFFVMENVPRARTSKAYAI